MEKEEKKEPSLRIENESLPDHHQAGSSSVQTQPDVGSKHQQYIDKDPEKYGVQFSDDEEYYDPPEDDSELPDLYRYLNGLEEGDTDLEANREPPSLFNRPEHVISYKNISHLKYEIEEETVHTYVKDFDVKTKDDVLMIGNISLEEIQEEEKRLRDEQIAYQEQELERQKLTKQELLRQEEITKKRVASDLKEKRRQLARKIEIAKQKERLQLDMLHKAFKRSENQLTTALKRRKAEVKTMYGDLSIADGEYGGAKGRRWKLDWDKTPQPIQVKLKSLRGVKDKLPGGRFVLMVSLYNRLGGHVMRWSKLKGQQWGGATLPTIHDGNFYNYEMKLDQSVFTVLPSKPSLRPGMVLVFELFLLRGAVVQTDRVVAWGAFPICDGSFDVIEGKYKTPFLRGEMDPRIDKHTKIEELMASDLDHWMCNLYFEVVRLPRYMAGQKEFEVELQFTSGIVNHPDRIDMDGEEYKDSENPIQGSIMSSDINSQHGSMVDFGRKEKKGAADMEDTRSVKSFRMMMDPDHTTSEDTDSLNLTKNPALDQMTGKMSPEFRKRPMTTIGSRYAKREHNVHLDESSSDSEIDDEQMFALKKGNEEFKPVKGEPGLYYKRHLNNPVDIYAKKLYTMLPKSSLLRRKRQKRKLTYAEQLEEHSPSVKPPFSEKGRLAEKGWKRLNYVGRQMMAELGLSEWRSREFWGMLMMFVFSFFLRIYLHYCGQWLFLKAINIPINSFDFLPYTVKLNYQNSLLHTLEEIAVVAMGPLTVFFLFVLCVLLSWIMQMTLGMFPDIGSKFIMNVGIQAFMDPIFILIVDAAMQNYNYNDLPTDMPLADFSKMYWYFQRTEGSGIGGIFVTVFLYFFIFFATASVLYMYFLRLHNNGRMLDIYWRLHSEQDQVFVPYDLEISIQELSYICKKAEQWRGEEGERRKVAVYEYVWEEEDLDYDIFDENGMPQGKQTKKEVTTHVAIHTVHLDGLRELFRHFLALPDGAVVEVFGEMSYVPGLDKEVKSAVNQGSKRVEDLMASQMSFHKVRGRHTAFTRSGFHEDTTLLVPGATPMMSQLSSTQSLRPLSADKKNA